MFRDPRISIAYLNTILYTTVGTAISLSTTAAAAYALSKDDKLLFHGFFSVMIIITMFFGGGMIPTYLTVRKLGLYNTMWAVVLPSAISAWNLLVMKSFFINFPKEIEESGTIDGLNDLGVFWYLVLPLSKAVLASIGLFYAVGIWNSFFGPFIYLKDPDKYPLQVILRNIVLAGANIDLEAASAAEMICGGGFPQICHYYCLCCAHYSCISFLTKVFCERSDDWFYKRLILMLVGY